MFSFRMRSGIFWIWNPNIRLKILSLTRLRYIRCNLIRFCVDWHGLSRDCDPFCTKTHENRVNEEKKFDIIFVHYSRWRMASCRRRRCPAVDCVSASCTATGSPAASPVAGPPDRCGSPARRPRSFPASRRPRLVRISNRGFRSGHKDEFYSKSCEQVLEASKETKNTSLFEL